MSDITERGKTLENKFFHDQETKFRIDSRRRKLLGLWAAKQMHMNAQKSLEYSLEIVRFGMENPQSGSVIEKIAQDITNKGLRTTQEAIRNHMQECQQQAESEITAED